MKFDISDGADGFHSDLFAKLSKEDQIEFMRDWFYQRYEDPAERTPYESSEGGYQYIHGGPFDAGDVLRDNFHPEAREGAIEELEDELSNQCSDWTYAPSAEDYDFGYDYMSEFDEIVSDFELILRLSASLDAVVRLVTHSKKFDEREQKFSNMMNFSFCITLLEAYLSEAFARAIRSSIEVKDRYLKNERKLSGTKFSLGEIFEKYADIDEIIKKQITETSFHNLPMVKSMFHSVLGVDVGEIDFLVSFVGKRHDFVHRGGKDTNGENVNTDADEIGKLVEWIKSFSTAIDKQLTDKGYLEAAPF